MRGQPVGSAHGGITPDPAPEHVDPRPDARARPERPEQRDRGERAGRPGRAEGQRGGPAVDVFAARLAGVGRAGVELYVDQHQQAEDAPEQGVGHREAPASPQPERLVGVQHPGRQEHHRRRHRQRRRLRPPLEPEHHRVEDDPDHEIFPVDVDPPPVVGERPSPAGNGGASREAGTRTDGASRRPCGTGPRPAGRAGSCTRGSPPGWPAVHLVGRDQQLVIDQAVRAGGGTCPGTSSASPRRWVAWTSGAK